MSAHHTENIFLHNLLKRNHSRISPGAIVMPSLPPAVFPTYFYPCSVQSQYSNIQNIWSKIYPVGSIYMSANATNPGNLFGGTWQQIAGRFLLAAGGGYSAGETGGEATHKLTVSEMPAHTHGIDYQGIYGAASGTWNGGVAATGSGTVQTKSTGGGGSHNNMPPYIVVYVWKSAA